VHLAFAEAWAWLEAQGLLVPAEGINGTNGFRHLSRRARQFASDTDFADYRIARLIPREILNARIAAKPARNESMGAIRRKRGRLRPAANRRLHGTLVGSEVAGVRLTDALRRIQLSRRWRTR